MARSQAHAEADRGQLIDYEGMRYAPENELGVVFLFSKLARRLGFVEIDRIQPHFPDCWAYRKVGDRVRRTWIEFEFRSRGFETHLRQRHLRRIKPKRGVVVCWDHDWPECEKYAEVIPLRQELNCGRQVWTQNTRPRYQEWLDYAPRKHRQRWSWTVAKSARPGDLLLMYRAGTRTQARKHGADENRLQSIADVFMVCTTPRREPRYKWEADVKQVAKLTQPLRLAQLKADRVLATAPFVRAQMRGKHNVTAYWYRLYDLIVRQNPAEVRRWLRPYAPEKL